MEAKSSGSQQLFRFSSKPVAHFHHVHWVDIGWSNVEKKMHFFAQKPKVQQDTDHQSTEPKRRKLRHGDRQDSALGQHDAVAEVQHLETGSVDSKTKKQTDVERRKKHKVLPNGWLSSFLTPTTVGFMICINTPRQGVPPDGRHTRPGRNINYHQPYMGVSSTIIYIQLGRSTKVLGNIKLPPL